MQGPFTAVKVSEHVHWVGAIDWTLRDFHGYHTSRGSTYNAYLIMADKITLVDVVKAPFQEELLARIASVVDPGEIDYIISNHSEMDHTGCLPQMIQAIKPERVFASTIGAQTLENFFHLDQEIVAVEDGQTIKFGDVDLTFLETRMLHWPDSMMCYLSEDQLLFSQDGFGMHLASGERFADQVENWILDHEAARYYANILLPYSPLVTKLVKRVEDLGLTMKFIAPDHGPIWRGESHRIVDLYARWAEQKPTSKAVVIYDTMWGSTDKMARAIGDGIVSAGGTVKLMSLNSFHRSDVATEILEAGALLVGSSTINNGMYPTVADVLTYLKGLKPKNLIGAAFGSFGWSGESVGLIREALDQMKVAPVGEDIKVKYVPDQKALARCRALGESVAERLREISV